MNKCAKYRYACQSNMEGMYFRFLGIFFKKIAEESWVVCYQSKITSVTFTFKSLLGGLDQKVATLNVHIYDAKPFVNYVTKFSEGTPEQNGRNKRFASWS